MHLCFKKITTFFILSFLVYSQENTVWDQIFELEFLSELHSLRSLEFENHAFSGNLSVSALSE